MTKNLKPNFIDDRDCFISNKNSVIIISYKCSREKNELCNCICLQGAYWQSNKKRSYFDRMKIENSYGEYSDCPKRSAS